MMIVPKTDLDELWLRAEALRLSTSFVLTCLSDHDVETARAEAERVLFCRLPGLLTTLEGLGAEASPQNADATEEQPCTLATIADQRLRYHLQQALLAARQDDEAHQGDPSAITFALQVLVDQVCAQAGGGVRDAG